MCKWYNHVDCVLPFGQNDRAACCHGPEGQLFLNFNSFGTAYLQHSLLICNMCLTHHACALMPRSSVWCTETHTDSCRSCSTTPLCLFVNHNRVLQDTSSPREIYTRSLGQSLKLEATAGRLRLDSRQWHGCLSSPPLYPHRLWAHWASYSVGIGGLFRGDKVAGSGGWSLMFIWCRGLRMCGALTL
jgi:hypothetical protein